MAAFWSLFAIALCVITGIIVVVGDVLPFLSRSSSWLWKLTLFLAALIVLAFGLRFVAQISN